MYLRPPKVMSTYSIDITDQQWQEMWKTHQTSTSSQSLREFSWKNLIRFFIMPKIKNKYLKTNYMCWRECGDLEAGHAHIFWKCNKIARFWGIVHDVLLKILGYDIPMNCKTLYMRNLNEGHIHIGQGEQKWKKMDYIQELKQQQTQGSRK